MARPSQVPVPESNHDPSPPSARGSIRRAIYEQLREMILQGDLEAGQQLSPKELAERFGSSTMPVREALRLLGEEGLVEVAPRKWTRVASPDPDLLDEIYPVLAILERHAISDATKVPVSQLTEARRANAELADAAVRGDVSACARADDRFHEVLIGLSRNRTLRRLIADLKARIRLLEGAYYRTDDASDSIRQHEQIIAALAREDPEEAGRIVSANWRMGHRKLREALASS